MAAESNVGARIFLIGKDAALAGLKEISAAVATLNKQVAAGADASKVAAAGDDEQAAAIARMNLAMDTYKANLAATTVATDSLARVGKYAFFGLAAAGAAWGYESVKWAQSFQTALVQLQTQAGLTARAVRAIGNYAEPTAANLGISPTTYLQAIYHPASSGFGVKQAETITNQAVRLAKIGSSSPTTTVNALTGVMRAYDLTKKGTAEKTAAKLNAIIGAGNMHASTLASALTTGVAASARTFGVSLTSLGAAMDFMTRQGVAPQRAATYLRMAISRIGAPTAKANTLLKQAGLTTAKILSSDNALSQMLQEDTVTSTQLTKALRTNKGKGGIYNALELLHQTLTKAHLTKSMQASMISSMFGGGRMGTAIDMMYSTLTQVGATSKKVRTTGTKSAFNKDWIKETQTLDFQLTKLGATIEMLGEQFGTQLIPPLTKVVGMFADMLSWLNKNKSVAYGLASMIGLVLVPAIGLYLYRALFKAGGAIRSVLQGYQNLLSGNSQEQISLQQTADQLTLTSAQTQNLADRTTALGGAASTTAGKIAIQSGAMDTNAGAAGRQVEATDDDTAANVKLGGAASTAAGRIAVESGAEDTNVGAADADAGAATRLGAADTRLGTTALEGGAGAAAAARAAAASTTLLGVATVFAALMAKPYFQKWALELTHKKKDKTMFSGEFDLKYLYSKKGDVAKILFPFLSETARHDTAHVFDTARHDTAHVFDDVKHDVGKTADDAWHDVLSFFGSSSPPWQSVKQPDIVIHNHVLLKDKEVAKSTTRVMRHNASLAGA